MILIFKNNNYELDTTPSDFGLTASAYTNATASLSSFFIKTELDGLTCEYPQNIKIYFLDG